MPSSIRAAFLLLMLCSSTKLRAVEAAATTAFECTVRQEEEDLAAIEAEEYRYHGAMVRLGVCALQQGTAAKAAEGREWLEKAAALGDPEAKNNLGTMYARGGVAGLPLDPQRAHDLYLEAAMDGCADAMHNLGITYDTGRGGVVAQNAEEAAHWFFQAAEKNHFEAMHALALMEVEGRGVERDLERATKRFRKLIKPEIDPPFPNAHYMLGMITLQTAMQTAQHLGGLDKAISGLLTDGRKNDGNDIDSNKADDEDECEYDEEEDVYICDEEGEEGEGDLVRQLRRGLDLLRAAREMGHPQAKDQLDVLESALPPGM